MWNTKMMAAAKALSEIPIRFKNAKIPSKITVDGMRGICSQYGIFFKYSMADVPETTAVAMYEIIYLRNEN